MQILLQYDVGLILKKTKQYLSTLSL